jgi:cytochrome oxidase Cu insertion factor (SCO1/SenC/PrrC family)
MRHSGSLQKLTLTAFIASSLLVLIAGVIWGIKLIPRLHSQATPQPADLAIGGFPMSGSLAPDFTLSDQFGHTVTLSSFRGREVVLAFIDARCTTLCPLTAQIMYSAKASLGASATGRIALVAVNANPSATSIAAVQAWSIAHGMLHQWSFLTGPATQLQAIYRAYQVYDQVNSNGEATHDPTTIIIDAQGHERLYFETLDSTAQVDLRDQEVGMEAGMRQWLPK